MTLAPYSGDGQPCPKCGYNLIATEYHPSNPPQGRVIYTPPRWPFSEDMAYLERRCQRCAHSWPEATVAQPVSSEAS